MQVNKPVPNPFTIPIPAKATGIEVWFDNWTGSRNQGLSVNNTSAQSWSFSVGKE